jgi:tetratricopeptide (TPR) repeat protein
MPSACCSCGRSGCPKAIAELEAAARLAFENARYGYVYAVALHDTGRPQQAQAALAQVLARHPHDRPTLSALVGYALERGDAGRALEHARRLAELEPSNSDVHRLASVSPRSSGDDRRDAQSFTATTSISTMRSGWASLLTSIVVLVGMAPKYSMRTSVCLKNSSMLVT